MKLFNISAHFALKCVIIWVILLSVLYITLSLVRHNNYQSGGYDLGIFDQAVWQYSQFQYPYNTIKERFILGDHLTLTLPLIAPVYWVFSDVRMLLIIQAIWISCSAIAVFLIARNRKFTPFVSLILSVLYSLFYGIQYGVYFDFHPVILGVGFLAWMIYFFEVKKTKLFTSFLALTLFTQENMGIALACLGCVYLFEKEKRKAAILFIVGGISSSFLLLKVTSFLSPVGYEYSPTIPLNPFVIIQQFFNHQDKVLVWLYSFGWFSFIPLFSPGALMAVLLDLAQYFLPQKEYAHMITPFFHHRAILGVFLIMGTFQVLGFLQKKKMHVTYLVIALLVSALVQQYVLHNPLNKLIKKDYWIHIQWMKDNDRLLKQVPLQAHIAAQDNLVPHLSQRKHIYIAWPRQKDIPERPCGQDTCWFLEFAGKPEYLVVNLDQNQWLTMLLESPQNFISAIYNMEKIGQIKKEKQEGSAILYRILK